MTREEYIKRLDEQKRIQSLMKGDKYLLSYHLAPPSGWLNDPNGLCEIAGINHIYYQYTPFDATWGMKLWGHYTTEDWIKYRDEEPFLFSDVEDDRDGVYSGSAFLKDGEIYFYYTGNVKYVDKDYDYTTAGREQNTIMVTSKDGFTHTAKKTLLKNIDYPSDMSCHVRDPQIFEKDGSYYMVLGARTLQDKGCILIYTSKDLVDWKYHMRVETEEKFGYMWECPNIVELSGEMFLICCPQGVEQRGIDFANVYQCGYFPLKLNLKNKTYKLGEFVELDRGFDIYAPQAFTDETGRKILIGWMGIPDAEYNNEPTVKKGWQHALTLPRELKSKNGKIYQTPLVEFENLREEEIEFSNSQAENVELKIKFNSCDNLKVVLRESIEMRYDSGIFTLNLEKCGYGRKERAVKIDTLEELHIFLDRSSIEIFLNSGEQVFSSRCYCEKLEAKISISGEYEMESSSYYKLKGIEITK